MDRSEEFGGGVEGARNPQFFSVQQQHDRNYHPTSVASQLRPGQNGQADADYERKLINVPRSPIGMGSETYDKGLWMRGETREPSQKYDQAFDEEDDE